MPDALLTNAAVIHGVDPGPAPRRLSLLAIFGALPFPLQIGTVATPTVLGAMALATMLWDFDWGAKGFLALLIAPVVLAVWLRRCYRCARHGVPVLGDVIRSLNPDGPFPTCVEVRYSYDFEGKTHRGSFVSTKGELLERCHGGHKLWLLVDPRQPSSSLPSQL